MNDTPIRALVIGLGNPLMGDDGAGLAALERLREGWRVPEGVELVDGGTWGMNLLPIIEGCPCVLLLDAIDTGSPPGGLTVLERDEIPRYFQLKLSPHQIDLREVLGLAELRGKLPERLIAIGVQPQRIEMGIRLSPAVTDAVDKIAHAAVDALELAGFACERRLSPSDA
jgi:hydrogenase maturation protease